MRKNKKEQLLLFEESDNQSTLPAPKGCLPTTDPEAFRVLFQFTWLRPADWLCQENLACQITTCQYGDEVFYLRENICDTGWAGEGEEPAFRQVLELWANRHAYAEIKALVDRLDALKRPVIPNPAFTPAWVIKRVKGPRQQPFRAYSPGMATDKKEASLPTLQLVPIHFARACQFVREHHRHHGPPQGHKFSLAVSVGENLAGVAIVGRPVARALDDGWTLEVTRLCTDGTPNACSKLYAAAWRTAKAMGYRKLITYILEDEKGTSLQSAGWKRMAKAGGGSWSTPSRIRQDKHPLRGKVRWQAGSG